MPYEHFYLFTLPCYLLPPAKKISPPYWAS